MAGNKSRVEVEFTGNSKGFLAAASDVVNSLTGLNTKWGSLGSSLTNLFTNPTAAIGTAVTALGALVEKSMSTAIEVGRMSQRVGTSVESMSLLKFAAERSGLQLENLTGAMAKLSKSAFAASESSSEQAKTFERLGVSVKNQDGTFKDTGVLLLDIAEKFKGMPDGIGKTATAMQLFGKSGAEMVPFLNKGREGIEDLEKKAKSLGLEISSKSVENAKTFRTGIKDINSAVSGFGMSLMSEVVPALASVGKSLTKMVNDGGPVIIFLTKGLGYAFKAVMTTVYAFIGGMTVVGDLLGIVGATLAKLVSGDFKGAWDVIGRGYDKIQKDSLSTGESIKALWTDAGKSASTYVDEQGKLTNDPGLDKQKERIKRLKEEWEKSEEALAKDTAKNSMSELAFKFWEVTERAKELHKKFDEIGKSDAIEKQIEKLRIALADFDNLKGYDLFKGQAAKVPVEIKPTNSNLNNPTMDYIDSTTSSLDSFFNATNERSIQMRETLSNSFGSMGQAAEIFYNLSGQKSKELFALQKAMAIGQAIMNTYEGASKAIAQGGVFGGILAGAVIAMGMAQVAQIAATRPGQTSVNSSGINTTIPTIPTSRDSGSESGPARSVQVVINNYSNYSPDPTKFAREVAPIIKQAFDDYGYN